MRFFDGVRGALPALMLVCLILLGGCKKAPDTTVIGNFKMGETVQAGPLTYRVMEAHWGSEVPGVTNRPTDRYVVIRLDITNTGDRIIPLPTLTMQNAKGQSYSEVTKGVSEAPGWLGLLRTLNPKQKMEGTVVFDAPIGGYRLLLPDGGEVGSEKFANVEIPADLG